MAEILRATMALEEEHEYRHYCGDIRQARENSDRLKCLLEPKGFKVVRFAGEVSFGRGIAIGGHNWAQVSINETEGLYDTTLAMHDETYRNSLAELLRTPAFDDADRTHIERQLVHLALYADKNVPMWQRVLGEIPEGVRYHGEPVFLDKHLM